MVDIATVSSNYTYFIKLIWFLNPIKRLSWLSSNVNIQQLRQRPLGHPLGRIGRGVRCAEVSSCCESSSGAEGPTW